MTTNFRKVALLLLLALAELEGSTAQECEAQVVIATQEELKKQISSEIVNTLNATFAELPRQEGLNRIEKKLDTLNVEIEKLKVQINSLHEDGSAPCYAAGSCTEILTNNPSSSSGYYWVKNATGHPHSVYCDMTRSCGGVTGGWMRVAYLNMTNRRHQCPSALRQRTDSGVRTCAPSGGTSTGTCSSVPYSSSGIHYSKVCGRIHAYRENSVDGFVKFSVPTSPVTIDSNYVDGVSLTHGRNPRQHIWTFATRARCPCGPAPTFINNDYFCDASGGEINLQNILWDGENCAPGTCCTINNPPWFYQQLPQPTTDDIEMRVCRDQRLKDEDIRIEVIEMYVQ